jgi:hypothetical protein
MVDIKDYKKIIMCRLSTSNIEYGDIIIGFSNNTLKHEIQIDNLKN